MRRYTAGFLFKQTGPSPVQKKVLLVRKAHPTWQAGLMNGIGGQIENNGETAAACMAREFNEEASFYTNAWDHFAVESGPGYTVSFFRHTLDTERQLESPYDPPACNDVGEELEWCDAWQPKYPLVGNLNWLLPMALDPRPLMCLLTTTGDIKELKTW